MAVVVEKLSKAQRFGNTVRPVKRRLRVRACMPDVMVMAVCFVLASPRVGFAVHIMPYLM